MKEPEVYEVETDDGPVEVVSYDYEKMFREYKPRIPKAPAREQVESFLDTLELAFDNGQEVVIPHEQLRDLIDSIEPRRALGRGPIWPKR